MSLDLKHTEASFSPSLIDSLYLRVAEMPRCRDMAIFVWITGDRRTNQLLYPLLRMRAHGINIASLRYNYIHVARRPTTRPI